MDYETYFALRLPFTIGVVTTLLLFSGWLSTERGTVIRAGNFPYSVVKEKDCSWVMWLSEGAVKYWGTAEESFLNQQCGSIKTSEKSFK